MLNSASDIPVLASLRNDPSDNAIRSAIKAVRSRHSEDPETAANLASILAASGETIASTDDLVADVASTGGPSSLSTLLSPLYLRAAGAVVPKLGVPGRPAGGIDCLAQIPGYRTALSGGEVSSILRSGGYAHFLAGEKLAPLDARMFRLRQETGTQGVPVLVAASLLAKKLAVGVKYVCLDIRVAPHGNFGIDWASASRNARLFLEAAKLLGINAFSVLTDAQYPYQPYFGRSEALVALHDVFKGTASPWLDGHCMTCRDLAITCLPKSLRAKAVGAGRKDLLAHFEQNVRDQGGDTAGFEAVVKATKAAHRAELVAERPGFCTFPLGELRDILVRWQRESKTGTIRFPDPVGLIFMQPPGIWVEKGTVLATVRAPDAHLGEVLQRLRQLICKPLANPEGPGIEAIDGYEG